MSDYLIHDSTLDDIADAIRAKTGGSSLIAPEDMPTEIASISSGTTITDGIVVKARNANGYPTEIDFYGTSVSDYLFGQGSNNTVGWMYLATVNYKTAVTQLGTYSFAYAGRDSNAPCPIPSTLTGAARGAFYGSHFVSAVFPTSFTARLADNIFTYNSKLISVVAPCVTSLALSGGSGNGQFYSCTGLQTVEIGSIGYGVTNSSQYSFRNCTQTGLTITMYTIGSYVDTLVSNIRTGATNATIIIKASEATEYNGTSYAAGDTILTSEVTS